jgi:integrase
VKSRHQLTDLKIRNLKADPNKRIEIADAVQRGLYLIVQSSGRRTFAVRYWINGHSYKLTLQPGLSLADARKTAADIAFDLQKGIDPRAAKLAEKEKSAAAAANTLQSVCERYLKREGSKLRTADDRERALRRLVFTVLGTRQIDTIRRTEISNLLDGIEDKNGSRAADLVLSYLRKIFNWYAVQSDTFSSPIVPGMSRYDYSKHMRTRVLDDNEIRILWQATAHNHPFSSLLRFLLLTGCRRSEGAELRYSEITGNKWLLPASRHKNKKIDLLRPLSDAALAIVHAQPRINDSPFVFTISGDCPMSFSNSARTFLKNFGSDWVVHDLRRTSRTLLSRAGVDSDIAEKCLGHLPGTIRQVYDQHPYQTELLRAFEKLSTLIERIVNPPPANVTPMRQRKRM